MISESSGAAAALGLDASWQQALAHAIIQIPASSSEEKVDLALLFASSEFSDNFPELIVKAREGLGNPLLIGCSGQGVIGVRQEVEGEPALSLLTFSLPQAILAPTRLTQQDMQWCHEAEDWHRVTGVLPEAVNAWFLFVDPFSVDAEGLLAGLSEAYPGVPIAGGLASGDFGQRRTHLFLNDEVYDHGAVALALGGPYKVRTIVSQGCTPIGKPWIITGAHDHLIETIAQRPAYEVLVETVRALSPEVQQRARGNIFVGLAMDEYQARFSRGDFLIRNIIGVDPPTGSLAVGALPQPGQTIQFQLRDRVAADEDLRELLEVAKGSFGQQSPLAALLCSCNGRGRGLFGTPDHDAAVVAEGLGPIPLAGFFCNGEYGPVGARNFLHGYTASIALIVPGQLPDIRNASR